MAVAVDATGTKGKSSVIGTTGISYTGLTIGASLSNGALIVGLAHDVTVSSVAVVWDSGGTNQALTLIGATSGPGGNENTQWWGLVNPISGNKTLKVTWNAVTAEMYIGAQSYTGVNQTGGATSFAHFTGTSGTTNAPSRAVTSAVGNIVVANIAQDNVLNTVSGTVFWTIDNSGPNIGVGMFRSAGAASVTMSGAIGSSANWSISGVDIVAAASAAAGIGQTSPNIFLPNQGPLRGLKPTQAFPLASTPVSASLTGVASTSAAGTPTVTGFSNLTLTGVASTSAAGTPTVTGFASVTLTGVLGTSAAGTPTVTAAANVTINGVAATSAANVPTVTGFANVSLTGVSSASAAGIPTVTGFANVTLTGVASASQIGTISVTVGGAVNVNLTGVESASSAGTPTVTGFANVPLTGVAATGSAGTVSVVIPVSVSLTGVAATSAAGIPTVTGFANVTLSGIAATGTAADVTVSVPAGVSVSLLGVQATGLVGTLTTNLDAVTVTPTVPQFGGAGSVSTRGRTSPLASKPLVRSRSAYLSAIKPTRDEARTSETVLEELRKSTSLTAPKLEPKPERPFSATLAQLGNNEPAKGSSGIVAQMQREAQIASETKRRRDDDEALALLLLT